MKLNSATFISYKPAQSSDYPLYTLIICLGVLLLPFIYSESLVHKTILPKYAFITIISLLSFFFLLIRCREKKSFLINNTFYIFIAFYLFAASSILWSEFSGTYNFEIINLSCLLLLFFTCLQINKFKNVELILSTAVIGGTASVLIVFIQLWGWNPLQHVIEGFPAASFINKNHLANYVDLLIPVCFGLLLTSRSSILKWLYTFCLSFLFSFIIVSHTRASWLSLLIVLLLILLFSKKHPFLRNEFIKIPMTMIFFTIFLSSILSLTAPALISESSRFSSLFSSSSTNSTSLRLQANKNAIKMIKNKPIAGIGLGSFYISYKPYKFQSDPNNQIHFLQLHNDPLQYFVELGFIGGILILSFSILIILLPYRTLTLSTSVEIPSKEKILYFSLLLSLISTGIHSFLSFPLHLPASSFLIVIFSGLLLNLISKPVAAGKKTIVIFLLLLLSASYIASKYYYTYTKSSYNLNNALKSNYVMYNYGTPKELKQSPPNKNNCIKAIKHTDKAIDLFNYDYYIHSWSHTIYSDCETNRTKKIMLAEKILKSDPYHFSALEMAAFMYFKEKEYSKAHQHLKSLNYLYPSKSRYTLWLGHTAAKQKKYKQAMLFYTRTIKLEPENKPAQEMILKLQSKIN